MKPLFPIDTLLKLFSFLGSILIFLSILKAYIFFATFNISITNYISFSEAILLFLNEVSMLLLYFLLLSAGLYLSYLIFHFFHPRIKPIDLVIPDQSSSIIHKLFSLFIVLYPIFYLLYAIVVNARNHSSAKNFLFWLCSLSLVEILLAIGVIRMWKIFRHDKNAVQTKAFLYLLFAAVLFFYTWALDRQLFLFHRNKINKPVMGWVKDKDRPVMLTNDSIQYLGSTGKYLFCYDMVRDRSIIINTAGFDRMEYGAYTNLPGFSVFDLLFH